MTHVIVPGPGSRSYRVPTLPDTTGYYYCTLQLGCSIVSNSSKKLCRVCSGLDDHCYDISDTIDLTPSYFCPDLNNHYTFPITAYVLNESKFDLIVGRKTIRGLNLFSRFPDQIFANASSSTIPLAEVLSSEQVDITCGCQPKENLLPSDGSPKVDPLTQKVKPAVTQTHVFLASLIQESERLFEAVPPDEDELSATPADIPSFDFHVNDDQWKVTKNRQPPWAKSTVDQADILSQIIKLEKQGIVEKSNAAYYSQVLLVPKSVGTKRLCIDFRNLNNCTEDKSHPIPHIGEMLRRIGAHKAKVFAVLDLTQGYHQAPLTLAACAYTAFILFAESINSLVYPLGQNKLPPISNRS